MGTDLCEADHKGYLVQGRSRIRMRDGSEGEAGPGDVFVVPPGHDAWVVGDEPCVALDFGGGAQEYAKDLSPAGRPGTGALGGPSGRVPDSPVEYPKSPRTPSNSSYAPVHDGR